MSKPQRKVVFFFPAFSSTEATAPLGILAVSTPLLRAGYQVRIIDSTITPNFQKRTLEELDDALCLAISLVTGPMIHETVQIARAAKRRYPDKPVILGGWHPSLLPDQTLAAECVDVVVKGQGEEALLEIVERIAAGESMKGIAGVGYKEDGRIVFNMPRALKPIRELPPKAYHLADFDEYERVCGRRWAMYTSSLACPYNCAYCTNDGVYGRKWNALEPAQVVEETSDLVERYGLSLLWIVDDNFLVDKERALGIAEGLVRRGVKFDWSVQSSTNLVSRFSVDELKLLRRAGLSQVSQGADSGSPESDAPDEQGFSEDRNDLHGGGQAVAGGNSSVVQHDLRLSGRRRERAEGIHRTHHGCLPAVSGRGVLDEYLHAVPGFTDHAACV